MENTFTYWQDPKDGMWLGYWNEYPDYQTEGYTLEDLKDMLISLREDIREMIAEGEIQESTKRVGELAFA